LRGESVALIDTFDRFDPASGAACGIDLSRLLWVRGQAITKTTGAIDPAWLPGARAVHGPGTLLERTIDRSLKSLNLVLQSRICTAVVLDFADVPLAGLRRVPLTTWMRLQRIVEGTDIACLLMGPVPLTRSAGGVTVVTGPPSRPEAASARSRPPSPRLRRDHAVAPVVFPGAEAGRSSPESVRAEADAVRGTGATGAERQRVDRLAGSERMRVQRPDLSERMRVETWTGEHDRSRRLAGLTVGVRVSSPRQSVHGNIALDTTTRLEAWAVE
jgi:hypothetical protein